MSRSPSSAGRRGPRGAVGELPEAGVSISLNDAVAGKRINGLVSTTPVNAAQGGAGPADLVAEVEALGERLSLVRDRIGEVIFGQREVVEQALITLLSGWPALARRGPRL